MSDGRVDSVDNISLLSDLEGVNVNEIVQPDAEGARKRGIGKLTRPGDETTDEAQNQPPPAKKVAFNFSCRLKAGLRGACIISCASIIELLGNLVFLVWGINYIQQVTSFFDTEADTEGRDNSYEQQLQSVIFLEENQIGFVGLLALCVIGMLVSFLMPIGAIYRSWKSLRAALSLLTAMCACHLVLACLYLKDTRLLISLLVVPYRIAEIVIIYRHISNYKRKKLEALLKAMSLAGNSSPTDNPVETPTVVEPMPDPEKKPKSKRNKADRNLMNQDLIGNPRMASLNSRRYNQQLQPDSGLGNQDPNGMDLNEDMQPKPKERKLSKKRRAQLAWLAEQERQLAAGQAQTSGNFPEYK